MSILRWVCLMTLAGLAPLSGCGLVVGVADLVSGDGDGDGDGDGGGDGDGDGDLDGGVLDAGPCAACSSDEGCFTDNEGSRCLERCVEDYNYTAYGFNLLSCTEAIPCVYEDADFFCRELENVEVDCNSNPPRQCLPDHKTLLIGCSEGRPILYVCPDVCDSATGTPRCLAEEVPAAWSCAPGTYAAADGCDCGCGAVDPDCADATADSCVFCAGCGEVDGGECTCGWPGGDCGIAIAPDDNSRCE